MSSAQIPTPEDKVTSKETPHALSAALLHELRTPLNHIIGYAEMLEERAHEAGHNEILDDLQKVHVAGQQLLRLINDNFIPLKTPGASDTNSVPFVFPALSGITGSADIARASALPEPSSSDDSQSLLLVVDDNEANRDVLSRLLEYQGYAVATAKDGRQALQAIRERAFDLVLLDIMMPEMDGYEVLQHLKADTGLRHLPVIMISALSELDSVVRCIEMGAEDYLPKPFNPTLLKARVSACLEKKRGHDREARLFAQVQENYHQLQALEKMREDLTHMIVHDLRAPLSSFLVGLQLMGDVAPLVDVQRECYDIAMRGGKTLLSMINDLLDISKMESGTLTLELAPLSIPLLMESFLEQITSSIREEQLSLVRQIDPDLPLVTSDENKLRRVLVNLTGNALKFTPSGGTICVGARRYTQENIDSILFSVSDTGEGIPEESFARIFEKFGQVESRHSRQHTSTGLGLTFCKMAVEAHGGRIWVESKLGEGSTFFFTIPL
ncbi:adaptive-response sensory-kinase SasA [Abditibacteriota bacterium]|nr:adaptive-response sensory-kinase SasA [Abditibacteriota bacterium]